MPLSDLVAGKLPLLASAVFSVVFSYMFMEITDAGQAVAGLAILGAMVLALFVTKFILDYLQHPWISPAHSHPWQTHGYVWDNTEYNVHGPNLPRGVVHLDAIAAQEAFGPPVPFFAFPGTYLVLPSIGTVMQGFTFGNAKWCTGHGQGSFCSGPNGCKNTIIYRCLMLWQETQNFIIPKQLLIFPVHFGPEDRHHAVVVGPIDKVGIRDLEYMRNNLSDLLGTEPIFEFDWPGLFPGHRSLPISRANSLARHMLDDNGEEEDQQDGDDGSATANEAKEEEDEDDHEDTGVINEEVEEAEQHWDH